MVNRQRSTPAEPTDVSVDRLSQDELDVDTYRVVEPDGSYDPEATPDLDDESFRDLYRWMVLQRTFDDRATKLQRRGRLGTYPSGRGQEASIVGAGFALADQDWIFPYGRETAALLMHGLSMRDLLLYWRGVEDASRMEGANIFGLAISIGSHIPVVAGKAWGMKLADEGSVAFANLGDGATSTGAFHEGINFAGVLGAPAVLFCQNNQYAITLPFDGQTNADTVAQKALAYGIDGIRVDGNDVLAVYNAVAEARKRALEGNPVLVEAVTYRRGAHTTSDDPTRYRSEDEVEEWKERDPLERYQTFLEETGRWDAIDEEAIREEVDEEFSAAVDAADEFAERGVEEMFAYLYEEMPPELERQQAAFEQVLEERPEMYEYIEQRPKG
ncbi:pyruvate dehydrogenase (acetyl-transferring) E1 component subunit alpha [Natrarchaeobaculum aegyptiacum]|uniref:Pyruvate dehydrogenase (Acetyl-transferring) E1 component subunit alpha n=1 Tax=Natrarchaeobaculum aegyptiacum TaxID=745377 RepID=A0A2Z2HUN9_9EURY|nr:pyruvate dehydrogenase (acetyl-transferring) E1 component subunit alpha [Natrarchaeobaculum aegyptiacum]ARS91016.1 pyruvate dehydrogenase (acetyl-transferring) E1 component subunit alpha [Natrarchaeobaculum aegyptiacum]